MNRIEDPNIVFYLKHQTQIEEWRHLKSELNKREPEVIAFYEERLGQIQKWLKLRPAVADISKKFFRSMKPDLDDLATQLGKDVIVEDCSDDKVISWRMHREKNWDNPTISIFLEWSKSTAYFGFKGGSISVWVDTDEEKGRKLSPLIAIHGGNEHSEPDNDYPVIRRLTPQAEYWNDLDSFRQKIIREVRRMWGEYVPLIDEFIERQNRLQNG